MSSLWLMNGHAQKKNSISAFVGTSVNYNNQAYSLNGFYSPFIATTKVFPSLGLSFDYVGKRNEKCINRLFLASHILGQKTIADKKKFKSAEKLYVQSILYSIQAGYNKEWQLANLNKTNDVKLFAGFLTSINYGLAIQSNYKNEPLINNQGDSLYFVKDPRQIKKGFYAMINIGVTSRVVFYSQEGKEKYSTGIQFMSGIGRSSVSNVAYFYENYIDNIAISNRGYICNLFFSVPIFRK
jgi:hypothetical protein